MIVSILIFLLVLSVLVLVHEFGHFIVARRAGVWVEEFGFGLPPRIFGKKIGETIWSLNLLPFGGFVKLHGESSEEEVIKPQKAFVSKGKLSRALIIVAGVFMNLILAIVAFAVVYSFSGIPRETKDVRILDIAQNSPALTAGLHVGDIVRKVDSTEVSRVKDFVNLIDSKKGKTTVLEIGRGSPQQTLKISLIPRQNPPANEGPLGVAITTTEIYFPPIWQRPFVGAYYGTRDSFSTTKLVIQGLFGAAGDVSEGKIPKGTTGPLGIFALVDYVVRLGVLPLINLVGIISINLAVLNLIPFPGLDGGRLLFIGIEAVSGRKVLPKAEAYAHTIGIIILLILLLAITAHDIQRLIAAGSISGFLNSVLK